MLGFRFCAQAFSSCDERGPLFIAVHGPLTIAASLVAEHRLQMHRLSSCGSQTQLLHGMWDLPRPGLKSMSPALAGGFSTTAPPGKPQVILVVGSSLSSVYYATPFWLVVSAETSPVNLMGVPLYVVFPLLLLVSFVNLITIMSRHVSPWVYAAWDSLHFLDLGGYFLSCVREVFNYNVFKYFLGSLLSFLFLGLL